MSASAAPVRLDIAIVDRGLAPTRTKSSRLIKAGHVTVNGKVQTKPSFAVRPNDAIDVDLGDDYVSRGAYKLVGAFEVFKDHGLPEPVGMSCLDIGASTGGFTQVLLRRGAARVIALDVGHGQLDQRIEADPRVTDMSGVNIRDVTGDDLPWSPDMIVSDVSFISLTYVIPVIARISRPGTHVVLLVKPQFEVGRGNLSKNGVVDNPQLREQALLRVSECAQNHAMTVCGTAVSPIEGTFGNVEYLLYLRTGQVRAAQ